MIFFKYKSKKLVKEYFLRTDIKTMFLKGYNKVPIELQIIKQSTSFTSSEKLVFEKIYFMCLIIKGAKGWSTISNKKLSEDTGLHVNTIKKCVKSLHNKKMINKEIIEPWDIMNESKTNNRYRKMTINGGRKKTWVRKLVSVIIK